MDDPVLLRYYSDMLELATIFNHEIVRTEDAVWRWRETAPHANHIAGFFTALGTVPMTVEQRMKAYMTTGYSLCGFADIFDSETIDRVIKIHRGKTLKL